VNYLELVVVVVTVAVVIVLGSYMTASNLVKSDVSENSLVSNFMVEI
jgi:hypothetical protein